MAERRMFAKTIIDSDVFLDMPQSTQNLYFHLGMRADDDGFINNPRKIMRMVGGSDDDLRLLISKRYVLFFDSGVIVIKHWKIHNYIQKDRYKPTVYIEEKEQIITKDNKSYTEIDRRKERDVTQSDIMYPECIQSVRLGKVRLGKDRIGKASTDKSVCVAEMDTEESKDPPLEIYEGEEPEQDDPFADVEIEEAKRYQYSDKEVSKFIAYANSLKCFPAEKRLLVNIYNASQILDALSYFSKDEIRQALDNYAAIKADPEEYDMRPFKTLVNFFTNDGIPKFISESDPWTNYRRKVGVIEAREEREAREANEAYQREKGES